MIGTAFVFPQDDAAGVHSTSFVRRIQRSLADVQRYPFTPALHDPLANSERTESKDASSTTEPIGRASRTVRAEETVEDRNCY
jgi:hypothetical protein